MQSAVLDACVLYPAALRDFFMRLAVRLYQPLWTDQIHDEWMRNVLETRPDLSYAQLARTRELMDVHGGACLVTGYQALIPELTLPDAGDRHVLAAAISAQSPTIVTFNLRDFPSSVLAIHAIRAIHPDEFAQELYELDPDQFVSLAKRHRLALINLPKQFDEYLSTLAQCGLPQTALRLQSRRDEL